MQIQYPMLAKVEVEMTQEKEMDELPNRPSKFGFPIKSPPWTILWFKFWGFSLLKI